MKQVTICIPCYNEEESLPQLYPHLKALMDSEAFYAWHLLMVDDGSSDDTARVIQELSELDPRIDYLILSRNFGKEAALMAAIDHADGDCVVLMDADGQDPPELVHEMLRWWERGFQDVYTRRRTRGSESRVKHTMSMLFYRLMSAASDIDMPENVGDFRLLDRQCILALRRLRETERYNKGLFSWIGFKKKELVFDRADRSVGTTHWSIWRLTDLAIGAFTSFTTAPLRIATLIGAVIAAGAFCFLVFYISKTLIVGDPVQGFTTLVSIMLFLGGVQLLSIGILGEYIARIYGESKHRPNYIVKAAKENS